MEGAGSTMKLPWTHPYHDKNDNYPYYTDDDSDDDDNPDEDYDE